MKAASCQHIRRKTPEREKMTPRDQNKNKAGMKEEEAKVKRGNERGRKHKPTAYNVDNRIQEDIKNQMKSSAVN